MMVGEGYWPLWNKAVRPENKFDENSNQYSS